MASVVKEGEQGADFRWKIVVLMNLLWIQRGFAMQ
jgi:hypothetical protein